MASLIVHTTNGRELRFEANALTFSGDLIFLLADEADVAMFRGEHVNRITVEENESVVPNSTPAEGIGSYELTDRRIEPDLFD